MRLKRSILYIVILILFMTGHELMAADASLFQGAVTIDADSIAYDKEEDTFHAKGDVAVTFSQGFLMADSVSMNRKTENLLAEGHVMIMSGDDLLEGDKVTFNTKAKTGVAYAGSMFFEENHFYIKGSKIMKTGAATYRVTDASATTCDGDVPDWRFLSRELDVTIDGYGTMKHGRFLLKDIPVFYVPFMIFPAKTSRQSGLLFPQIAYSRDKFGLDIEIPFFWAISEKTDATFYQRYMEKRGFKEGMEFRYNISEDTFGTLYGDFMNDSGPALDTPDGISRNWQSPQKRWSLYLNHETTLSPSIFFRADIRKVSDQWYFKDFSSNNYYLNNYSQNEAQRFKKIPFVGDETLDSLESTVRLVKNWPLFNITGLISDTNSLTDASNDMTLQRCPEITLKGARSPLWGTLLNLEIDAAYDYYYRTTGQKGHLYDIQPVFSLPLNIGDYFQVIPQIGVKSTLWDRDDSVAGEEKHDNRQLYTVGFTATTEAYRIFDMGAERIEKIRHGIKPEVTYTYIPNVDQENIPNYTTKIPEQNTITYALTNTLMARIKQKDNKTSYLEVMRLKLAQTYDIVEATRADIVPFREKRPFSDIDVEFDIKPSPYVTFSARNKYNVYINGWDQTNYDLNFLDSRGDTATIGYRFSESSLNAINYSTSISPFSLYRYSQTSLKEINLFIKAEISKSIDVVHILRRNELDKKTVESTFGLNYHRQCWNVDIRYSESETDKGFTVLFSLYGFGKSPGSAWIY